MASLYEIRAAIKARLSTIAGLRVHGAVPDNLQPPAVFVGPPDSVDFDVVMKRGADRWSLPVRLAVARSTDRSAQAALDAYLAGSGASSVKAAIEGDRSLGGLAHTTRVREVRSYGVFEHAGVQYLGAELVLEVIA